MIATYRDLKQAKDVDVVIGDGEPIKRLRHPYTDKTSATESAQAELDKGQRSEQSLSISLPGRPGIRAERKLNIEGLRAGVNGEWLIKQVEHSLDGSGLRTSLRAEVVN